MTPSLVGYGCPHCTHDAANSALDCEFADCSPTGPKATCFRASEQPINLCKRFFFPAFSLSFCVILARHCDAQAQLSFDRFSASPPVSGCITSVATVGHARWVTFANLKDGSFAEFVHVNNAITKLTPIPSRLSDEQRLVITTCCPPDSSRPSKLKNQLAEVQRPRRKLSQVTSELKWKNFEKDWG
jgi:hypothetical protein